MDNVKYFEEYTIVNKSTLDTAGNWSAQYHVHLAHGRKPYIKKGYKLVEVEVGPKKSLPANGVVFLKPEIAAKLNEIGEDVEKYMQTWNDYFDANIYAAHAKGYEDPDLQNLRSGVREIGETDEK